MEISDKCINVKHKWKIRKLNMVKRSSSWETIKTLCNYPFYPPSFFPLLFWNFVIVNEYFWFWKSVSMADQPCDFSFFWDLHIAIDNDWHFHLHNTYVHQIWKVGTSRGIDSLETYQFPFQQRLTWATWSRENN